MTSVDRDLLFQRESLRLTLSKSLKMVKITITPPPFAGMDLKSLFTLLPDSLKNLVFWDVVNFCEPLVVQPSCAYCYNLLDDHSFHCPENDLSEEDLSFEEEAQWGLSPEEDLF